MNTIDLHLHSTHSDGSYAPAELITLAEEKGMRAISITDHDTLTHIKESLELAKTSSVEVIGGVEVSADFTGGTMHIIGYFVDPANDALYGMLERFRAARADRNPKIIEKLQELGIPIEYEEVLREAGGLAVGRPHIARAMIKKGVVKSFEEAFHKYLAKGKPAYVNRERFKSDQIISVIHQARGLAFLSHPKQLNIKNQDDLDRLVGELVRQGLDGIEVYSSCHSPQESAHYLTLAKKYNLLITGGSDYHGTSKEDIEMGYIGEGIELQYEIVTNMRERLQSQYG